jgi:hypothetical protein
MITVKPTRTPGRVMIESDGCSDYYGGALVQGATVCRISAPGDLAAEYSARDGHFYLAKFLFDIQSGARDPRFNRVRVLERRIIR